jgi:precorrin-4 methylase
MIRTIARSIVEKAKELVDWRSRERDFLRHRLGLAEDRCATAEKMLQIRRRSLYYLVYTPGTQAMFAQVRLLMRPPTFREEHDAVIIVRMSLGDEGAHVLKDTSAAFHRLHSKEMS